MSLQTMLAIIFTILASVCLVAVIILLGWFLIWKAFLSKFRLVRELLGQTGDEEDTLEDHRQQKRQQKTQQEQQQQQQQKRSLKLALLQLDQQEEGATLEAVTLRKIPKKN